MRLQHGQGVGKLGMGVPPHAVLLAMQLEKTVLHCTVVPYGPPLGTCSHVHGSWRCLHNAS